MTSHERHVVSNHRSFDCLFNSLCGPTSKSALLALCVENSPVTGEFPAHRASNAEKVSSWWRHHGRMGPGHKLWYWLSSLEITQPHHHGPTGFTCKPDNDVLLLIMMSEKYIRNINCNISNFFTNEGVTRIEYSGFLIDWCSGLYR